MNRESLFTPSKFLVRSLMNCMIKPTDKETLDLISDLGLNNIKEDEIEKNISSIITEQMEGFITQNAKRYSRTGIGGEIFDTYEIRFSPEACLDIINRLGIDPYICHDFLSTLYEELYSFLEKEEKQRKWGKFYLKNGQIKFEIKKDIFKIPNNSEIFSKEGDRI